MWDNNSNISGKFLIFHLKFKENGIFKHLNYCWESLLLSWSKDFCEI